MSNSNETDVFEADLYSGIAAFDSKNFSMAYQLLGPLAETGNAEALWRIGMMQMNGLGMVENQTLGFDNFNKSASLGHPFAHHMVAVAYMTGEGVNKDTSKAIEW
ncbi:MAG: sel1 repeat family protein, partial [Candidatus Thioglobus sp.]